MEIICSSSSSIHLLVADCIIIASIFLALRHRCCFLDARFGLAKIVLWSSTLTYVKSVVPQLISSAITLLLNHMTRALQDENDDLDYFSKGASKAVIDALPTKIYRTTCSDFQDDEGMGHSNSNVKCCICLNKYADGECVKELLCLHHFHIHCVDKWLAISATCPLCKYKIRIAPLVEDVDTYM